VRILARVLPRSTGPFVAGRVGLLAAVALACVLGAPTAEAASWWHPPQKLTWYWQLTGTPLVEPVDATDVDGFDTTAATVAALHARGQHVICYIDVGTAENWRPDYGQFASTDLGSSNGWPGEQWLNITDPAIRPIMVARFQMCQQKGFDAVEPDNMDGYANSTGFSISASQQAAYDEWVAEEVHSLGMAVLQKNDPDQAAEFQPYFDGALSEQCNQYSECSNYAPYVAAGKPVLDAEYQSSLYPGFCAADAAAGIMGALYDVALDGAAYEPCFGPTTTSGGSPPPAGPSGGASGSSGSAKGPAGTGKVASLVVIARGPLRAVNGLIHVRLRCLTTESYCVGELRVETVLAVSRGSRRTPLLLGTAKFRLRGARYGVIAVKLRAAGRRRLRKRGRVAVRLSVFAKDRAGRTARSQRIDQLRIIGARA
jgi:hypothetical protein